MQSCENLEPESVSLVDIDCFTEMQQHVSEVYGFLSWFEKWRVSCRFKKARSAVNWRSMHRINRNGWKFTKTSSWLFLGIALLDSSMTMKVPGILERRPSDCRRISSSSRSVIMSRFIFCTKPTASRSPRIDYHHHGRRSAAIWSHDQSSDWESIQSFQDCGRERLS